MVFASIFQQEYLKKYGYVSDEDSPDTLNGDLKQFQEFFGLPITGTMFMQTSSFRPLIPAQVNFEFRSSKLIAAFFRITFFQARSVWLPPPPFAPPSRISGAATGFHKFQMGAPVSYGTRAPPPVVTPLHCGLDRARGFIW